MAQHNGRDQRAVLDLHAVEELAAYDRARAPALALPVREQLADVTTRERQTPARQRPAFGWNSMSEAELRLAATGLTNRVIADELDLSRHTGESHLRRAFHKLDVRSRVELTRIVLSHEPSLDE